MNGNYAERAAFINPIAAELERTAYQLRQGATSDERAADKLRLLAGMLSDATSLNDAATLGTVTTTNQETTS